MAAESIPKHSRLNRWRWKAIRFSRRMRHRLRISWRRPLAPWRALPHFIIIGAQKCGTSSLYAYLATHPQVRSASWKEVHYFDLHYDEGLSWYRSHFPLGARLQRHNAITGEASPYYLCHPRAAERIAELLPTVRLIVLLRDPTARTISHYWHQVKRGREQRSLEEALALEEVRFEIDASRHTENLHSRYNHFNFSYKKRSLYGEQLRRYYNLFGEKQIMVIKSEDFFNNVQATFNRVTEHLGLAPWTLPDPEPRNAGAYPKAPANVKQQLDSFFRLHNRALYDLIGVSEAWW